MRATAVILRVSTCQHAFSSLGRGRWRLWVRAARDPPGRLLATCPARWSRERARVTRGGDTPYAPTQRVGSILQRVRKAIEDSNHRAAPILRHDAGPFAAAAREGLRPGVRSCERSRNYWLRESRSHVAGEEQPGVAIHRGVPAARRGGNPAQHHLQREAGRVNCALRPVRQAACCGAARQGAQSDSSAGARVLPAARRATSATPPAVAAAGPLPVATPCGS